MIQVIDLKKEFPNAPKPALENISLTIFEKEIFCLLGHNGAGKTTLMNILSGLTSQTKGSLLYDHVVMDSKSIFKSIGFCSQDDIALLDNTVKENLVFLANIRGVAQDSVRKEVESLINKLDLVSSQDKIVRGLSKEQRKKLSIAIASLNNPRIIMMDEPTSGLDSASRKAFWKIIKGLKADQRTVIFTTQFLDDAEELSDRLAILSKGTLFAVGSSDFIKTKFGSGYTLLITNRYFLTFLV